MISEIRRSSSCPPWKRPRQFSEILAKSESLGKPTLIRPGQTRSECRQIESSFDIAKGKNYQQDSKPHKCYECGRGFKHKLHLILHQRIHDKDKPKPSSCKECGTCLLHKCLKNYSQEESNTCFIEKDTKPCTYEECGTSVIQTNQKPYTYSACETCLIKPFLKTYTYDDFEVCVAPSPEKPYVFDKYAMSFIQKAFRGKKSMKKLVFECGECGQVFSQELHMILHKRVHSRQKRYECDECEMTFSHQSQLRTHKCKHLGENPYKCSQCDLSFSKELRLVWHNRLHPKRKPCNKCDTNIRLWTADIDVYKQ